MPRIVELPPQRELLADGSKAGGWWRETDEQGRLVCELCPRECNLKPGDRGFCFVRENRDGEMVLSTYGRSTGFCIDPIEKKPLNHFHPGTSVLSFGTAGCNLGCKFCQNWDISKSREVERLSQQATPDMIAAAAQRLGCKSVAYTYNDPIIWAEYAIDCARACRSAGVKSVAVTAGYITPQARAPFFHAMDAANVDLKAFTEEFYRHITYSHLQPVLDTLHWLKHESEVWFEITNLVIPRENDSDDEFRRMCDWLLEHVGDETPLHFTAFHPDFRMQDRPNTPHETLLAAYETARAQGIKYVYVGNVHDVKHQSTYCPGCGQLLIQRDWHQLGAYNLRENRCGACDATIAGHFDAAPGAWGRRRLPVRISDFAPPPAAQPAPGDRSAMTAEPAPQPEDAPSPELTGEQQAAIHGAACEFIAAEVLGRPAKLPDPALGGAAQQTVMGAFVTLKRRQRLRGCCGSLGRPMPLIEALQNSAVRTASQDMRLPPVSPTELSCLDLDVSLLFGFRPISARGAERAASVEIGRHGLTIQRGQSSGLLLPSVAVEHGLDPEGFLRQVCRKAGLPSTAWQQDDTQLQTFEAHAFGGDFKSAALTDANQQRPAPATAADMELLASHCKQNLAALAQGATPNYYLPGGVDGTVSGAALTVRIGDEGPPVSFAKISMRPGVPLQATLFQLAEAAAQSLRARSLDLAGAHVGVAVLYDPAMHGTVDDVDLDGFDPQSRALMAIENTKTAWMFDPSQSAEELLAAVSRQAHVNDPATANVFSLAALATDPPVSITTAPQPAAGRAERAPAVAGTFYPGDAAGLEKLVDDCLAGNGSPTRRWPALMIPHAGLVYSGKIAAAALRQVEFPNTAIVIGPKHTRLGVEWAVAPHEKWLFPGAEVASDPQLARELATAIDGLELDAAAHQNEHGIEVELPFFARLAPNTRVVGVAIGAGNHERCRKFAAGLAEVIRRQQQPPLLVISSDMNHYATDAENRRLDELALTALESLDPAALYETVNRHSISMCGVLPALIVMETLRELGGLKECQRVAYGTSADVSGDTSRVVGYASALLG